MSKKNMSNIAIKAENLGKAYQLGQIGTGTISRDIERWFAKIRGKEDPYLRIGEANDRSKSGSSDIVWSLKDINFEIEQGDAVGIIGKNGAGKSTLLKILSKVTAPTTGSISGKGRIASLLEVGTGFHPELSGRENIYLNGAILGMRKKEIQRKFDEIVDFAGVERYIDTPVKRYSSGMYVRLAFAVAAHLESEILIVDEVLAVGDAEFQKKCLGKMGDVSKGEGRTVLFVSHNMSSIRQLCNKGLFMENGFSYGVEKIENSLNNYTKSQENHLANLTWTGQLNTTDNNVSLNELKIETNLNHTIISNCTPIKIIVKYSINIKAEKKYRFVLSFYTHDMINLFNTAFFSFTELGTYTKTLELPYPLLSKNKYKVLCRIDRPGEEIFLNEKEYINFEISEIDYHSFGVIFGDEPGGLFHFPIK